MSERNLREAKLLLDGDLVDPVPIGQPSASQPVNYQHHQSQTLDIDCYNSCIRQLQKGISGLKYNYANTKEKKVLINVSQDGKYLTYQGVDKISTWNLMKGPT